MHKIHKTNSIFVSLVLLMVTFKLERKSIS